MRTQSFRDVEVIFRGTRAWAQARVVGTKVEIATIRMEGVVDHRQQAVEHVFTDASPENAASSVRAFDGLPDDERADLFRQVKDAFRD